MDSSIRFWAVLAALIAFRHSSDMILALKASANDGMGKPEDNGGIRNLDVIFIRMYVYFYITLSHAAVFAGHSVLFGRGRLLVLTTVRTPDGGSHPQSHSGKTFPL